MPLASLENATERGAIRARLGSFQPNSARRWGTFTPGGAVCHLAASYEMALGEELCSERTGPLQRTLLRLGALHVPLRWPRGVPTLPELVEGAPRVQPGDFDQDRARLLLAFDRFARARDLPGRKHPIFGPLTDWEWMRWGLLHADHHLRQFAL